MYTVVMELLNAMEAGYFELKNRVLVSNQLSDVAWLLIVPWETILS